MGNLVKMSLSEVVATLEKLDALGVEPEDFARVRQERKQAKRVAKTFEYESIRGNIPKVFQIICEGSADILELIARGKYDYWKGRITNKRFPLEAHASVTRTIQFKEYYRKPDLRCAIVALGSSGCELPTVEDCLYFGIQHPEEQRERPIVFTLLTDLLGSSVLVLGGDDGERYLRLASFDDFWGGGCAIAGVRKPA